MFEKLRQPVSGLMHLFAAGAALIGLVGLLISARGDTLKLVALAVYGTSLVLMFSASSAYHLVRSARPFVTPLLRKLDHSAIYLLIAGTYTPLCLIYFTGFWRWGLLSLVWALAVVGIAVKVFVIDAPRWVTAGVYLVMGWLSILAMGEILQKMPQGAIVWLLLGGFFFTVGALVYITRRPNFYPEVFGFHEVWHIFVILGCFSHFVVMAAFVAP
jgi:hemolysin III